jgi:hypothetical protein
MRLCLEERSDRSDLGGGSKCHLTTHLCREAKKAGNDGALGKSASQSGPTLVAWHRDRPRQKKSKSEWLGACRAARSHAASLRLLGGAAARVSSSESDQQTKSGQNVTCFSRQQSHEPCTNTS